MSAVGGVIMRSILRTPGEEDGMPRKYQNGKLEIRSDVDRPYYFIRITVPRITSSGQRKVRERKLLGFVDEITKKEAMKLRAEALEVANSGRALIQSQIKFSELVTRYREARMARFGVGTQQRYESHLENHILPTFGKLKLSEIDRPMVEAWLTAKENDGLGWWSRHGLRSILSTMFNAAREWNIWTGDNPAHKVRIGKKRVIREKRHLTTEQFQRIMAGVSESTRFMILVASVLGLRISEVCGLQWQDIDFEAGTLHVQRRWYRGDLDKPKTESSDRVCELGPMVGNFRALYPGPHAANKYIFIGEDGVNPPDERDLLRFELRPLLKRLGLYYLGFGWHAFRRQNITLRQTVGGATPVEAQKAAGHSSVNMTMLYTLSDKERERDQVTAIYNSFMGQPAGLKQ